MPKVKELTTAERRAARKAARTSAPAAAKPVLPVIKHKCTVFKPQREYTFDVPADFKPFFLEVIFRTDIDGMLNLHEEFKVNYHRGRYDDDEAKKRDMYEYDPLTVSSLFVRLGMLTYHPTGKIGTNGTPKRLEPSTVYKAVFRIQARLNKAAGDDAPKILGASLQKVWMSIRVKVDGKTKRRAVELGKTDPYYRLIRKSSAYLPAAFKGMIQPPKRGRKNKTDEEEAE